MSRIREFLSVTLGGLLVVGYLASQWFTFQGRAPEYARLVDVRAVAMVALLGLGLLIGLALADRNPPEESQ